MAPRSIRSFRQDEEGVWVAELSCGHPQHVRHSPPWQLRPWVTTPAGREGKLGTLLDCPFCDMPTLPDGLVHVRWTPIFDQDTLPRGLRAAHDTKAGTWGRIVVEEGKLRYTLEPPREGSWVLRPGIDGIIEPAVAHRVAPVGTVRFRVEFLREG